MIILDTSAVVDLAGNKPWAIKAVANQSFFVSVVTLAEVHIGTKLSKNKTEKVALLLEKLFENKLAEVLNIDAKIAYRFATLQSELLNKGLPLAPLDGFIAATALEYKAALVTSDSDFKRVKQLKLITP
ncbi:type II toxin-antitoxin system VapC family toxin [Candidatus Amesbacteria bacterium]|nr:type II toxin-antitoxin system VapC family toxin [Candidatus Amesbacteria bacterium]